MCPRMGNVHRRQATCCHPKVWQNGPGHRHRTKVWSAPARKGTFDPTGLSGPSLPVFRRKSGSLTPSFLPDSRAGFRRAYRERPYRPDSEDLLTTATTAAAAVTTATAATAFPAKVTPGGIDGHKQQEGQQYDALYVHNMDTVRNAISQAMTHWNVMIITAHMVPSSRRMVAMAATHGV